MARKRYSAKPKAAIIIFIIVIAYAISFSVMLLFRPSTAIYEVVAGGLTQTYTARRPGNETGKSLQCREQWCYIIFSK